jgi:signal peptidase I
VALTEVTKRRRPIISFLLSLCLTGLGQLYNGNPLRGALAYLWFWAALTALSLSGLTTSFRGMIVFLIIGYALWILIAVDSAIGAARTKTASLRWYNRWYIYAAALLVVGLVITPALAYAVQYSMAGVRTFRTPAGSMEPALKLGECFLTKLAPYRAGCPARGDIVVFPYPDDESKMFVKRVVGLPGERFEIIDKRIFVNGARLEDPWGVFDSVQTLRGNVSPRDNFGPIDIPKGSVFVMGDNRDLSFDSRFWGSVSCKDIQGKVLYIYWSDEWGRIGKQL